MASALWNRFVDLPTLEPLRIFVFCVHLINHESGGLAVNFHNNDDASFNDLYHVLVCETGPSHEANDRGLCMNHTGQKTLVWLVTDVFTMGWMSQVYNLVSYLRMGNNMTQLKDYALTLFRERQNLSIRSGCGLTGFSIFGTWLS